MGVRAQNCRESSRGANFDSALLASTTLARIGTWLPQMSAAPKDASSGPFVKHDMFYYEDGDIVILVSLSRLVGCLADFKRLNTRYFAFLRSILNFGVLFSGICFLFLSLEIWKRERTIGL